MKIDKIAFIGFMGSGKSCAAKQLADALGWRCLDSDTIIERREKKSIAKIFKDKGESYFRTVESKVIKDLLLKPETVLSFGGGAVCRKVNRTLLKKRAYVIWLKASSTVIDKRTSNSSARPLLNVSNRKKVIMEMMKERDAFYKQCANVEVVNNSDNALPKLKRIPEIKKLIKQFKASKA